MKAPVKIHNKKKTARVTLAGDRAVLRNTHEGDQRVSTVQSNNVPPCLPDCQFADSRERDLADRLEQGHNCAVHVADLPSGPEVLVVRWVDADGTAEPACVEVSDLEHDLPDLTKLAREDAAALASALAEAAAFAAQVDSRTPPRPIDDELADVRAELDRVSVRLRELDRLVRTEAGQ